jgi:hypothetical protein
VELNAADRLTAIETVRRTAQPWPNRIIECITQTNQIMVDMPFVECNNGTFHTLVRRTSLTEATSRKYYKGTHTTASTTESVSEPTGMYQAIAEIDADQADHSGDPDGVMKTEAVARINGMGTQQSRNWIYGRKSPKQDEGDIDGFATRLSKIGERVIDMGGTGSDLTSVYLVALGETLLHGIYPKGFGTVGTKTIHEGIVSTLDDEGGKYQVYRTYFKAQYGIALEDPRALIRIANIPLNINPSDLLDEILLQRLMLPEGAPTYALYGNIIMRSIINKAAYQKGNVIYPTNDPWGRPITMIEDMRVRTVDAILRTEEQVA